MDKVRKKTSGKKKAVLITALAIVSLILIYLVCEVLSIVIFSGKDETEHADCIIVLGAAVYGDEPSPVFRERIEHGIRLYKEGWAGKIIFTGGRSGEDDIAESEAARNYAVSRGVPEEDIYTENRSTITQENIEYSLGIMEREGLETALIVSDPLHMRRAMTLAAYYGIKAYSSPTTTTMYRSLGTQFPFLMREAYYYI